ADAKDDVPALVDGEGAVMIDWQRAAVRGVKLYAKKIDNTGAKPNERLRVSDCRFSGSGRIYCQGCDTPEILRNAFHNDGPKEVAEAAIHAHTSPLAEIRSNTVRGPFIIGIAVNATSDPVVVGNVVEKCGI